MSFYQYIYLFKCTQLKLSIWACKLHKPGVVVSIECKEDIRHLSITFVKQLDVVGLNRMEEHEDKMTVGNKGHPEGSHLPQVAIAHLLFIGVILLNEG